MKMNRTAIAATAAVLAFGLGACGAGNTSVGESEPTASASPSTVPIPSLTPSQSKVDSEALGESMAADAILESVWKDTPKEKRIGTCNRWKSSPEDIYNVPLFSAMEREQVKDFFDGVCSAG